MMDLQTKLIRSVGTDRLLHFAFGGWISSYFDSYVLLPILIAFIIGFVKDALIDKYIRKSVCDWTEILATTLGGVVATIITIIIR